jgi:hypothetical protein
MQISTRVGVVQAIAFLRGGFWLLYLAARVVEAKCRRNRVAVSFPQYAVNS